MKRALSKSESRKRESERGVPSSFATRHNKLPKWKYQKTSAGKTRKSEHRRSEEEPVLLLLPCHATPPPTIIPKQERNTEYTRCMQMRLPHSQVTKCIFSPWKPFHHSTQSHYPKPSFSPFILDYLYANNADKLSVMMRMMRYGVTSTHTNQDFHSFHSSLPPPTA